MLRKGSAGLVTASSVFLITHVCVDVIHVPLSALPRDLANPLLFKFGGPIGRAGPRSTIPTIANDDIKIICVSKIALWVSRAYANRPVFHSSPSMSSSEDEAQSPVTGASSSNDPPPPLNRDASSSDDELPAKKSRKYKRPRIE